MRTRLFLTTLLLAACAPLAHAANTVTDTDLENCNVLLGKTKNAAFDRTLKTLKQAAAAGAADDVMRYGAAMHNRLACLNTKYTGDEGWGMVMSNEDGTSVEAKHPPHADPAAHPDLAATLREAIRNFERIADTDLRARTLLGQYYADYDGYLKEAAKGYVYMAGVYSAQCRGVADRDKATQSRCQTLRQDRILYNSLVAPAQRARLDDTATAWADRYLARTQR
jgi:hypothetical protein